MIHRSDHESNYMMINNELARDSRLSLEARGLLVLMLSMSDDWNFSVKGLMTQTGLKRSVVIRLTKELKTAGYITYKVEKGKGGIFTATTWEIYEDCTAVRFDRGRKTPQSVKSNRGENTPQSVLSAVGENRSTVGPQYGETVVRSNEPIRNTNIDRSTNIERNTKKKEGRNFIPPDVEEVRAYCLERNNQINPETFVDFYTAKGWMVGKNKMKDWKAAVRTWEKDRHPASKAQTLPTSSNPFTELKRREGLI